MRNASYLFLTASLLAVNVQTSAAETNPAGSPRTETLTEEQMHDVEGVYALGDGRTAEIKVIDDRLYLDVGRRGRWQLLEAGADTFTTRNNEISLVFRRSAEMADNDQIVLNYGSASRRAR